MSKHTPGYRVTCDGRVFSFGHNWRGYGEREMRQTLNASGYPSVRLTIEGLRKRLPVHRLVAHEYIGPCPNGMQICHINGDRTDNRVENLRYGTAQDNADDRERHGRTSRGAKHSHAIKSSGHAEAVRRNAAALTMQERKRRSDAMRSMRSVTVKATGTGND